MTSPLIQKYEEVYGKKPVDGGMIHEISKIESGSSTITGAAGSDVISLGGAVGNSYISNGFTIPSPTMQIVSSHRSHSIPNVTSIEQQFNKVLEDIERGRAIVSIISSDLDQSFTGFGGQIKYTVEIIGTYP